MGNSCRELCYRKKSSSRNFHRPHNLYEKNIKNDSHPYLQDDGRGTQSPSLKTQIEIHENVFYERRKENCILYEMQSSMFFLLDYLAVRRS